MVDATDSKLNLRIERSAESIPARVVRLVRQAIMDGSLPPGRRLTERELCDLTGVSRTSIREAITHLTNLGLVEPTDGRGVRVTVWSGEDIRQLYEIRDALEPATVDLFVRNASDQQVAELLNHVPPAVMDPEERLKMISEFDRLLAEGAGNPMLKDMLDGVHARIHALRRLSTSVEGRQAASTQEYMDIAAAIQARSPERARQASHLHVRAAAESAQIALRQMEPGTD